MKEWCKARVWDNGDMTECGNDIVRGRYCASCTDSSRRHLRGAIASKESELLELRAQLAKLEEAP